MTLGEKTMSTAAQPSTAAASPVIKNRILSIDQFRGWAILGMILVDYFGAFDNTWRQLHHPREGFTFADTIAPIFMFVVGMGMRLSMIRRIDRVGLQAARKGLLSRYVLLVLIAFTLYTGYLWDALMNIGLAGIIALWFVDRKPAQRFGIALAFLAVYQALVSLTEYGPLVHRVRDYEFTYLKTIFDLIPIGPELIDVPINGGPLGHWSWLMMLVCGTIAYDIMATKDKGKIITGCLAWGIALCLAGWLMRAEWPGVKELWPFSKYYMTSPYALFATGLCFLHLLLFYVINDMLHIELPHLTVLGLNPLFIYILHWCIMESAHRFLPKAPGMVFLWVGFAIFYGICYGTAYYMYRKNIFVKL